MINLVIVVCTFIGALILTHSYLLDYIPLTGNWIYLPAVLLSASAFGSLK